MGATFCPGETFEPDQTSILGTSWGYLGSIGGISWGNFGDIWGISWGIGGIWGGYLGDIGISISRYTQYLAGHTPGPLMVFLGISISRYTQYFMVFLYLGISRYSILYSVSGRTLPWAQRQRCGPVS